MAPWYLPGVTGLHRLPVAFRFRAHGGTCWGHHVNGAQTRNRLDATPEVVGGGLCRLAVAIGQRSAPAEERTRTSGNPETCTEESPGDTQGCPLRGLRQGTFEAALGVSNKLCQAGTPCGRARW